MMLCMLVRKKGFNQQHIPSLCSHAVFPTSPVNFLGHLTKPQHHVKTRAYRRRTRDPQASVVFVSVSSLNGLSILQYKLNILYITMPL